MNSLFFMGMTICLAGRAVVTASRTSGGGRPASFSHPCEDARDRVRAVFGAIREAITIGEFRDVLEQLDPGYADLLA
jgi:uncharacterized protein (DUF2267 family)